MAAFGMELFWLVMVWWQGDGVYLDYYEQEEFLMRRVLVDFGQEEPFFLEDFWLVLDFVQELDVVDQLNQNFFR